MKRIAVALLGVAIAALLALLGPSPTAAQQGDKEPAGQAAELEQGRFVYEADCATCHGLKGDGKGAQAAGFAQHPTDFIKGDYKLRSTTDDIPAAGDLERSIRVGMSGTEMVPFGRVLSPASIKAVAAYIRSFSPDLADPEALPDEDTIVKVPEKRPFPPSEQTVEEGKQLWDDNSCADCHGDRGEGTNDQTDDLNLHIEMVPFQDGYYKSGPSDADLYRTIATGMTGTPMDAYKDEVSDDDIWKLVDYIRSLSIPQNSGFIARQVRRLVHALLITRPSGFDYSDY
jgi:mono/diheme cytochrome c family protein